MSQNNTSPNASDKAKAEEGELPHPIVVASQMALEGFLKVRNDRLRYAHGYHYNYFTLIPPHAYAVVILAETQDGHFVLNEEYRHPTSRVLLGCPGGFLSEDENPLDGAARELCEETGYTAKNFKVMGQAYPFPGVCGQSIFYVHAWPATKMQAPQLEPSEILRTVLKTRLEIQQDMLSKKDIDSVLCTALYYHSLMENGLEGR